MTPSRPTHSLGHRGQPFPRRALALAGLLSLSVLGTSFAQPATRPTTGPVAGPTKPATPLPPPIYAIGESVRVREGDLWSPARVVEREGRKYLIRYQDQTEEWVHADRLRSGKFTEVVIGDGAAGQATDGTGKSATKPAITLPRGFPIATMVDVKSFDKWRPGRVSNIRNGWHLIDFGGNPTTFEWVEPWRIRRSGDETYEIESAPPNPPFSSKRMMNPPALKPPPKPAPTPPPVEKVKPRDWKPGAEPVTPDKAIGNVTPLDTSKMAIISIPAEFHWLYRPDSGSTDKRVDVPLAKGPFQLTGKHNDGRWSYSELHSVNGTAALIDYRNAREVINLATGKTVSHDDVMNDVRPPLDTVFTLAASPDAGRIICKVNDHDERRIRVDIYDLASDPARPVRVTSFEPFKQVASLEAWMIDRDRFVMSASDGRIRGMKVVGDRVHALWELTGPSRWPMVDPVFSPDGKTFVLDARSSLLIVDSITGTVLGKLPTPKRTLSRPIFSEDGNRVAVLSTGTLIVYELARGTVETAMWLPDSLLNWHLDSGSNAIEWLNGDVIYLKDMNVAFDLKSKTMLGRFEDPPELISSGGLQYAVVRSSKSFGAVIDGKPCPDSLASWRLPVRGNAAPAGVQIESITLPPGTPISIDLNGFDLTEAVRTRAVETLREMAVSRGWVVVTENAKLRIIGKTETLETLAVEITGRNGAKLGSVSFPHKRATLVFDYDGEVLRTLTEDNDISHGMLIVHEDESMQEAADLRTKLRYNFLDSVTLPQTFLISHDDREIPLYELGPTEAVVLRQPK